MRGKKIDIPPVYRQYTASMQPVVVVVIVVVVVVVACCRCCCCCLLLLLSSSFLPTASITGCDWTHDIGSEVPYLVRCKYYVSAYCWCCPTCSPTVGLPHTRYDYNACILCICEYTAGVTGTHTSRFLSDELIDERLLCDRVTAKFCSIIFCWNSTLSQERMIAALTITTHTSTTMTTTTTTTIIIIISSSSTCCSISQSYTWYVQFAV